MITVSGLTKHYGDRVAVDDVLTLIKQMCNLRATWEEATAGLEKQAAASN